ncbi:MAG: hypothetical protein Q9228_005254 [Teloschistes exilis]
MAGSKRLSDQISKTTAASRLRPNPAPFRLTSPFRRFLAPKLKAIQQPTSPSIELCPSPPDRIPHLKALHRSTSAPFTSTIPHSRTPDHAPSFASYHPHLLISTPLFFRSFNGKAPEPSIAAIQFARRAESSSIQLTRFGALPRLFFSNHMLLHIDH